MRGIDFMHTSSSIVWHIYDPLPSSGIMALGGMVYEYACLLAEQTQLSLMWLRPTQLIRGNGFGCGLWPGAAFRYILPSFAFCRLWPSPPFHPMAILCRSICRMSITRSACTAQPSLRCPDRASRNARSIGLSAKSRREARTCHRREHGPAQETF
jgi:hypothetical protein